MRICQWFSLTLVYETFFDKTLAWLITADAKKKSDKKQTTANIGAVEVNNGIGETGVHLIFHTSSEYDHLYGAQRYELHDWRHSSVENALTLETLKMVDAVFMVGAVDEVDVVRVVVVVEEVEDGEEATLKS